MVKYGGPRPVKAVVSQPTRALDTIYQNLTGRPILVIAVVDCTTGATATSKARAWADIGASTPPTTIVGRSGFDLASRTAQDEHTWCLPFAVPPGYYYRVRADVDGTGLVGLSYWTEVEL